MKCPKCNTSMGIGIAIDADPHEQARAITWFQHYITYETLKLIEVYKCPNCGYSDDGTDPTRLIGIVDNR